MSNRKERPDAVQGNRGKGRPKGTPNKLTSDVKAMILAALDKAGGVDYLVKQAEESPSAFMTLVGKVLPLQITGKDDAPLIPTPTSGVDWLGYPVKQSDDGGESV